MKTVPVVITVRLSLVQTWDIYHYNLSYCKVSASHKNKDDLEWCTSDECQ